jgi:hypothetical protein
MFMCEKCNKKYTARNSLWYHEKKSKYEKQIENENTNDKDKLITLLITQNKELMDLLKSTMINNTTNN